MRQHVVHDHRRTAQRQKGCETMKKAEIFWPTFDQITTTVFGCGGIYSVALFDVIRDQSNVIETNFFKPNDISPIKNKHVISHPSLDSAIARYCPLWVYYSFTDLFLRNQTKNSQWVTHPMIALNRTRLTSEFRWNLKPVSSKRSLVIGRGACTYKAHHPLSVGQCEMLHVNRHLINNPNHLQPHHLILVEV
ncbi:hypothetical protein DVH24_028047 [Malus domestica]|uniref:Uncharacterized protein n=1 Tax=Malus domestica TaxID=3750 RepID=A0A498HAP5_MALDO|nr:hypothetical protein DVH24_028047 [Malus domestica]